MYVRYIANDFVSLKIKLYLVYDVFAWFYPQR